MSLSIVIPAFNEGQHIFEVLTSVADAMLSKPYKDKNIELILVNDGSKDHTLKEAERFRLSRADICFHVLTHTKNRGYGAALKTGFDHAQNDYLSFMDGDGTINPQNIFQLYEDLVDSKNEMAVGHRFSQRNSKMPRLRRLGNIFFAKLLSFLSGEKINDSASGIRVFHRSILNRLYPLPDGLHFTPAMSAKAAHEKIKIIERPVDYSDREGQSKLSIVKDGMRFLRVILDTVLMYNPFKVFFGVGALLVLFGVLLLYKPLVGIVSPETKLFSDYIYRSIGALCFVVGGIQIILFGVMARFIVSTFFKRYESGNMIQALNRRLKIYDRIGYYGLGLLFMGCLVHVYYLSTYLVSGDLAYHWIWLGFGAIWFIVGLQMLITGVIMSVLKNIRNSIHVKLHE